MGEELPRDATHIFKSWDSIANDGEYWDWVQAVLVPGLFGDEPRGGWVQSYFKPLGGMQLRQSRVQRMPSCDLAGVLKTNRSDSRDDPYHLFALNCLPSN